ncbi:hypothetical protein ACSBR1_015523 [Camellia fascicularis]
MRFKVHVDDELDEYFHQPEKKRRLTPTFPRLSAASSRLASVALLWKPSRPPSRVALSVRGLYVRLFERG